MWNTARGRQSEGEIELTGGAAGGEREGAREERDKRGSTVMLGVGEESRRRSSRGRGGTERRIRKKAEGEETGQGGRSAVGGEPALVPVLIFTAKASSWSGTRRSVSSLATMPMMWYSSFGLRSRSMAVTLAMTVPGSADSSTLTVWIGLRNSGRESLMSSIRMVMRAVPERGTVPLSVATTTSL